MGLAPSQAQGAPVIERLEVALWPKHDQPRLLVIYRVTLAAAIAAGTTAGMGYAAAAWFDRGEKLSRQAVGRISRSVRG